MEDQYNDNLENKYNKNALFYVTHMVYGHPLLVIIPTSRFPEKMSIFDSKSCATHYLTINVF